MAEKKWDHIQKELDKMVLPYSKNREHLLLSVGIVTQEDRQTFRFGRFADNEQNLLYEIGSITKIYTTTLLSILAAEKGVSLNDPVVKYLPSLTKNKSLQSNELSLLHLATHTSGLPKIPAKFILKTLMSKEMRTNPYKYFTDQEFMEYAEGFNFKNAGKRFKYSNLGMGLLGHILCRVLGAEYESVIQEEICSPLNLRHTLVKLSDDSVMAQGYNHKNERVPAWDFESLAGAGALRSTIEDQLLFLEAQLRTDSSSPLGRAIRGTHQVYFDDNKSVSVGLGWILDQKENIIWHNGGTGGYTSFMGFNQSHGTGVVILSNYTPGFKPSDSLDAMGFSLLKFLSNN